MGYSKAQKTRTHKRIVSIASKRFREKGLAGFGIAELMKEAGLTVGGFYKHFGSRDDLVAPKRSTLHLAGGSVDRTLPNLADRRCPSQS